MIRAKQPSFAAQWDEAMEVAIDALELEARRRAMDNSDRMLEMLLQSHRPGRYRETVRQEHSGRQDIKLTVVYEEEAHDW